MRIHRHAWFIPTLLAGALVSAGLAGAGTASAALPSGSSVTTADLNVIYQGKTISSAAADALQVAAEAAKREFVIVYDPLSDAQGLAHAFDSRAAADSYGDTVKSRLRARPSAPSTAAAAPSTMSAASIPATCPDAYNISRLYADGSCGGNWWVFQLTDNKATLGALANQGSSLETGRTAGCVILVRLYPGPNYTYTEADFYGDPSAVLYHTFNSVQNDNFESGKSTCS